MTRVISAVIGIYNLEIEINVEQIHFVAIEILPLINFAYISDIRFACKEQDHVQEMSRHSLLLQTHLF